MDFIEQWFKLSPDGGNGIAELMIVIGALVACCCAAFAAVPRLRHALLRGIAGRQGRARQLL